ncbi:dipeptidase [Luteimonas sp. FCS-9]|uniref:dipeptidase n=1 Tax=Luteimonas sp. FCS-9 TaxID=1547516 RepID=UPI00063EC828|nr:dipeptidase [Luteimonas sp. FCS-9]KLJ01955.1 hypothetical protein WQ56_03565 [Luteimonas sp. FCS-9]
MRTVALSALLAAMLAGPTAAAGGDEAAALAQRLTIVDTHIDAPSRLQRRWADLGTLAPDREFDHPRAVAGGLDVAFMSIYTSAAQDAAGEAWQSAHAQIDAVEALAARHPDRFALLRAPGQVAAQRGQGRVLLAMGMENAAPLEGDPAAIAGFFDRGVRYLILAHGANNAFADSSYEAAPRWQGLSPAGRAAIAEMNRLGMMVDVSHLSDAATRQAVALSRAPVIAGHSAFRQLTPGFARNLDDDLARAIADRGGVVQIPFGTSFIDPRAAADLQALYRARNAFDARAAARAAAGEPPEDRAAFEAQWRREHPRVVASLDALLDQIDHGVRLLGAAHVGIGSDFDGVGGYLPVGLEDVSTYPAVIAGLQRRGYSEADIGAIMGGNLLRVWAEVEAAADGRR